MGLLTNTAAVLLVVASLASAFTPVFVPKGKELVYHYRTVIKAGTHTPASYVSQSVLEGNVHVQTDGNATYIKLSDLKHSLYNGVQDHHHELSTNQHQMDVPQTVLDLQKPFKIYYDVSGKFVGLAIDGAELEWVKNVKRSIASVFQMDVNAVFDHDHHTTIMTNEHSIYGMGPVSYNVMTKDDGLIVVQKMHEMKTPHHMFYHGFTTVTDHVFGTMTPIMHDSQKTYVIIKEEGHYFVKHIETTGGVYVHPFQMKSDSQYVFTNQTFDLTNVISVKTPVTHVNDDSIQHFLTYQPMTGSEEDIAFDLTNGRQHIDMSKLTGTVNQLLSDIVTYLGQNHIHTKVPTLEYAQLINRLQRILSKFNYQHLNHLDKVLDQQNAKKHAIYQKMIPLIGTKSSIMLIKEWIQTHSVTPTITIEILENFPKHVRTPSIELLAQFEFLLHLPETYPITVRKSALFAFANLVHFTYEHQMKTLKNQAIENYYDFEHIVQFKKPKVDLSIYTKYVKLYLDQMETVKDHKMQLVYIQSVYNMKVPVVVKMLAEKLQHIDYRLKTQCLLNFIPLTKYYPEEVFEVVWPILMDQQELTEIRIMAYNAIMAGRPVAARLYNMYWALMKEPNQELYHYHYSCMKSLIKTVDPMNYDMKIVAEQLIVYMQPPNHGVSQFVAYDYIDGAFKFTGGMQTSFINTNRTKIFALSTYQKYANVLNRDYGFYVKLTGFGDKIINSVNAANFGKLFQVMKEQFKSGNDFEIEVIMMKHEAIVRSWYVSRDNWDDLKFVMEFFTQPQYHYDEHNVYIAYEKYAEIIVPSEFGTPIVWQYMRPTVDEYHFNVKKDVSNTDKLVTIQFEMELKKWSSTRYGLSFYNVMGDIWQGVSRYHVYDTVLPISFDIIINPTQKSAKLSFKHKPHKMIGLRTHVSQMVFAKDDSETNVLQKSCKACKDFVVVTKGEHHTNDYVFYDYDDSETGYKYQTVVYDSDRFLSNSSFRNFLLSFVKPETKAVHTPFAYMTAGLMHFRQYLEVLPVHSNMGLMMKIAPSTVFPVTQIDFNYRFNHDDESSTGGKMLMTTLPMDYYTPATKYSTRMTINVKNGETVLKTWDLAAIFDMNQGHLVNGLKMHMTRLVPGDKEYKICVEYVKKWSGLKKVTGHVSFAMGPSTDGKCPKDSTMIDVTMLGEKSLEQIKGKATYGKCNYVIPYSNQYRYLTMDCLADVNSIRKYTYTVKTMNMGEEMKDYFMALWNHFKGYYWTRYNSEKIVEKFDMDTIQIELMYPMVGDVIDMTVKTPYWLHHFTDVHFDIFNEFGGFLVAPDTMTYSKAFMFMHKIGAVDHCTIYGDYIKFNDYKMDQVVPQDWTVYMADNMEQYKYGVLVKKTVIDNKDMMAMKIINKQHVIEVVPQGTTYQVMIDGTPLTMEYFYGEWATVEFVQNIQMTTKTIIVTVPQFGIHLEFDGHHIVTVVPKVPHYYQGKCFHNTMY